MKKNNYTLMELLVVLAVICGIPLVALVILAIVSPAVNYKDYEAERKIKIEEVQKQSQQAEDGE
jgi:competence protein ComGC